MGANAVDKKSTYLGVFKNKRAPLFATVKGLTIRRVQMITFLQGLHSMGEISRPANVDKQVLRPLNVRRAQVESHHPTKDLDQQVLHPRIVRRVHMKSFVRVLHRCDWWLVCNSC